MQDPITPPASAGPTAEVTQDEKMFAMLSYVLGFVAGFIPALVFYLIKKDQSKFIAFHAMQYLILSVGITVVSIAAGIISLVPVVGWIIGCVLYIAVAVAGIAALVFVIIAAIKSWNGEWYEIPVVGQYAKQIAGV